MMLRLAVLCGFVSICIGSSVQADDKKTAQIDFFEKQIRPILIKHCYECHSSASKKNKKLKGELLLDTRAGIRAGGETDPAVVPGKVTGSLIMSALRHQGGLEMPPKGKLPAAVIANFAKWIKMGAPDPRDGSVKKTTKIDWTTARQFWAFQQPRVSPRPAIKNDSWSKRKWDSFILAKQKTKGLSPVRLATKRELIRRATFDLIGLPPTVKEINDFEKDQSPQAFARVVNRLLASPHYGERWGRYWLDVARYADDKALAFANPWPHAWRYRDWVVNALNNDMPYDRFVRLQLAGDLLTEPKTDYTLRLAGLGFQGLGALYHKGSVAEQVKADELDDRIDTLSRGLLGLTVACARCHDHKYDPIPTSDYYSLAAAYNGATWSEVSLASPKLIARFNDGQRRIKEQTAILAQWVRDAAQRQGQKRFTEISRYMQVAWRINVCQAKGVKISVAEISNREILNPYFLNRFREFLRFDRKNAAVKHFPKLNEWFKHDGKNLKITKYEDARIPNTIRQIADQMQKSALSSLQIRGKSYSEYEKALAQAKNANEKKIIKRRPVEKQHAEFLKKLWLDTAGPLYVDSKTAERQLSGGEKPLLMALRKELDSRKKNAPPMYPKAHGVAGGGAAMPIYIRGNVNRKGGLASPGFLRIFSPTQKTSRQRFSRLDLANVICSSKNPLTARVIVNRVWQQHFGRGIVATASNFGRLGARPTHPQLLDTMAVEFMNSGWSIKWLHREMMLSTVYQLSADFDARNAVVDPANSLLWRFSPRRSDVESWRDAILAVSGRLDRKVGGPHVGGLNSNHVRRTLYGMVSRRDPNKMLIAFDFPDANVSSAKRSVTTVPQQQLFVLNSEFMIQSAEALAARLKKAASTGEKRITLAYQWAFARAPTSTEMQFNLKFLRIAAGNRDKEKLSAWGQFAQAILAANEFTWID